MEGKAITGGGKVGKQGKFQWGSAGNVLWEELNMRDLAYLRLLAREYPNVQAASSEIINLMAIRGLPKGTEYFFSDLHGEYEAFVHLLRSASGIIREKISETFGYVISDEDEIALANLIYYPERGLRAAKRENRFTEDWQRITIYRLVCICKEVSSKYTRSKVRKKMPPAFAYVIDELIHVDYSDENKKVYYDEIIRSIIDSEMGAEFIKALCNLIQNLTIDNLHIIGDIFDRGPRADIIMEELMKFHDVDIQWGNHDISWMGAATGNLACICNVLRIAIRYNLYGVSTCLPIPLYAVVACGIVSGGNYLTAFAASMLLALAAKNYCRSYCNGYGFDAIFRASLYLGLLPLVYAPATPLVLILPLAILLFRRTFREVVVAAAGLILPVLTACYVSWGAGEEFTAPVTALADAVVSGVPLWIFTALPLPSLVMLCIIAALALTALFFFLSDIYAAGTKPRFILIFNIGILAMTLALLCTPSVTPEAFTLTAVPAALLFPVLFVRIDRRIALPVYLILLAASVYIAALQ